MTWLHVSDWDCRRGKWKHVFHKGDARGNNAQPGVWIDPNKNDLHIRLDTENKPPVMVPKEGYPDYLIDIIRSGNSGPKDPNVILRTNGFTEVNGKMVNSEKLTRGDLLREHSNVEEIILLVKPNTRLTETTVPGWICNFKEKRIFRHSKVKKFICIKKFP